jgi:putative ABC transport system permease protein
MGVASAFSIQIINRSALAAFAGTMSAVSAGADLSVVGRTPDLDENALETVLGTQGVLAAWPLYRASVSLEADPSIFLDVLGFDLYMPVTVPFAGEPGDGSLALSTPGWVAVTPALAGEMGWEVGDSIAVTKGTRRTWLHIGALVDFQKANPLASRKLAVMDIAQAQHSLGGAGRIQQIDIRTVRDDQGTIADELRRRLGPSVQVMAPQQRRAVRTRRWCDAGLSSACCGRWERRERKC